MLIQKTSGNPPDASVRLLIDGNLSGMWDPATYLQFANERARPFADLVGQVRADRPAQVVDLGCGPGQLTASLADRWPGATVLGLDSSPEMVERASASVGPIVPLTGGLPPASVSSNCAALASAIRSSG